MPSSREREYERNTLLADKLRDGTITREEGQELFRVIDRYIRYYEKRKFRRTQWRDIHLDRVMLFYELLTDYYYDKPLGYVMTAFRMLAINLETLLHLRAQGLGVGESVRVVNTMQMLNLYIYERYRNEASYDPELPIKEVWLRERTKLGIQSNGSRAWRNFKKSIVNMQAVKPYLKSWYNMYWSMVTTERQLDFESPSIVDRDPDAKPLWGEVQHTDMEEEEYVWNE